MPGSASGRALVTLQETAVSAPLMRWLHGLQFSLCLQANPLSQRQPIIPAYMETLLEPWGGVCGPERHQGQADAASTQRGSSEGLDGAVVCPAWRDCLFDAVCELPLNQPIRLPCPPPSLPAWVLFPLIVERRLPAFHLQMQLRDVPGLPGSLCSGFLSDFLKLIIHFHLSRPHPLAPKHFLRCQNWTQTFSKVGSPCRITGPIGL